MNKVRITIECCWDAPFLSNCQKRLLKTTRREKSIPRERERERERGEKEDLPNTKRNNKTFGT
jgi:hypothetical protein